MSVDQPLSEDAASYDAVEIVHILLLGDASGEVRKALRELVTKHGLSSVVTRVETLASAIDALRVGTYDVCLLDFSSPGNGNVGKLTRVLETAPEMSTIVVTAVDGNKTAMECLEAGAQDYVNKGPFGGSMLRRGLLSVLSRRQILKQGDGQAARLRESEERFRSAFEDAAVGMVLVAPEGRVLRVNEAAVQILGYSAEEAESMDWESVFHPDELAAARANLGRLTRGEISRFCTERRVRHRNGHYLNVRINSSVARDGDDRVAHVISQIEDVTARVRAEERLRESERRHRQLFERNLAAVVRTSLDGRVLECNRAFAELLAYDSVSEARASDIRECYEEPAERVGLIAALKRDGEIRNREIVWRRRDGGRVVVLANASLIKMDGGQTIEMILIDLSRQRRLEEDLRQAQKMEAIGRLASSVAHDFNNLLTTINGYADLGLASLERKEPLYEELSNVRAAGERGVALTRKLLAFGRKHDFEPQVLDLNRVVRDIAPLLERLIGEDIEMVVSLDTSPGQVLADRGDIEQAVVDLVVNARDAMREGGKLSIETALVEVDECVREEHPQAALGVYVQLSIADTGHGMDGETAAHAFEPFFTTKEPGEGTGFGLSSVYATVERSGGFTSLHSEPGHSTTVRMWLPHVTETAVGKSREEVELPCGTESILLVEDDGGIRRFTQRALEAQGYRVRAESDPAQALDFLSDDEAQVDLLLTDLIMPGMSGVELARQVRDVRPETRIVVMSGYSRESALVDSAADGSKPFAFLDKPFSMQTLAAKVREVLDGS